MNNNEPRKAGAFNGDEIRKADGYNYEIIADAWLNISRSYEREIAKLRASMLLVFLYGALWMSIIMIVMMEGLS